MQRRNDYLKNPLEFDTRISIKNKIIGSNFYWQLRISTWSKEQFSFSWKYRRWIIFTKPHGYSPKRPSVNQRSL